MYRTLLAVVILALIIKMTTLINSEKWNFSRLLNALANEFTGFNRLVLLKIEPFNALRKFLYSLTAVLFLVLTITAFFPVLILGENLSGILLIIHVTVAPIFVLSFTFSLLFYAHIQQFDTNDWHYVSQDRAHQKFSQKSLYRFWKKVCFWLFAVFVLPAILSVILSMYPLFGTEGQYFLLDIHRYSVLFLFIISSIFVILKWSKNMRRSI